MHNLGSQKTLAADWSGSKSALEPARPVYSDLWGPSNVQRERTCWRFPTPNYEYVLAARPAGPICAAGTAAKVPRLGTSAPCDRSRGGMMEGPGEAPPGHARALRASPLA